MALCSSIFCILLLAAGSHARTYESLPRLNEVISYDDTSYEDEVPAHEDGAISYQAVKYPHTNMLPTEDGSRKKYNSLWKMPPIRQNDNSQESMLNYDEVSLVNTNGDGSDNDGLSFFIEETAPASQNRASEKQDGHEARDTNHVVLTAFQRYLTGMFRPRSIQYCEQSVNFALNSIFSNNDNINATQLDSIKDLAECLRKHGRKVLSKAMLQHRLQHTQLEELPSYDHEMSCDIKRTRHLLKESYDINGRKVYIDNDESGHSQQVYVHSCANECSSCKGVRGYSQCKLQYTYSYLRHRHVLNPLASSVWGLVLVPSHCACELLPGPYHQCIPHKL